MNQTQLALVLGGATIVVLGCKLHNRNRKIRLLIEDHNKLVGWGRIAQRVLRETINNNPELDLRVSKDLATEIEFYHIMESAELL
jgi:hypothetical protein